MFLAATRYKKTIENFGRFPHSCYSSECPYVKQKRNTSAENYTRKEIQWHDSNIALQPGFKWLYQNTANVSQNVIILNDILKKKNIID